VSLLIYLCLRCIFVVVFFPVAVWEDELSLRVGDVITDVEDCEDEDEWMRGTALDGTRGLFPGNFVTLLS